MIWNALAIIVLLVALVVIGVHTGFTLSLVALAFMASTWGNRQLERIFRFTFTPKLKAVTLSVLALLSVLTGFQYQARLDETAQQDRLRVLAAQKAQVEANRKETRRIDSLRMYLAKADRSIKQGAYRQAIGLYNQSAQWATANESNEQHRLHQGLALGYVRTKQYQLAIEQYNELGTLDGEALYQQAL